MPKKIHYKDELVKQKHNTKRLWKTINKIFNKSKRKTETSKSFCNTNKTDISTDSKQTATNFNIYSYYTNVGPNFASKITDNGNKTFKEYLAGNHKSSMHTLIEPITENELVKEIACISLKKSCGYDGINARVLKAIPNAICKPQSHLFNLTFTLGTILHGLKIALATPIFKGNDEKQFKNQTASILTHFSTLLQKLMMTGLTIFIIDHQYGFRKNRSTELAIIDSVNKITEGIDQGEFTIGIFLDLSKAFDAIDHKVLA